MSQFTDHEAAPATVTVTDAAAARVKRVIEEHRLPDTAGLRVGATEGGCSGLNYDVGIEEAPKRGDAVLDINGIRVFVNSFSAPHVLGMTVDWISTMQESRFVFHNPNATGGCGCGMSFTTE